MIADAGMLGEIVIRYDGLDAADHSIEIDAFADSLKGLGRIISMVGTFAATEKLIIHSDARPLKVVVGPPEPNCVTLVAAWAWVNQTAVISGTASALAASLITAIFTHFRGRSEEMKHLRAVAEEAIRVAGHRDDAVVERLLDTVDRMAEKLIPAVRQAVEPVGKTAQTMTIGDRSGTHKVVVDKAMRDAIQAETPLEVGDERIIDVRFIEMNLETRGCRIVIADGDSEERYTGEITDPEFLLADNAYASAFAAKVPVTVRARPTLRDGEIERWYISAHS